MPNSIARTSPEPAIPETAHDVKTQPEARLVPERVSTPELVDERYDNMPCTD